LNLDKRIYQGKQFIESREESQRRAVNIRKSSKWEESKNCSSALERMFQCERKYTGFPSTKLSLPVTRRVGATFLDVEEDPEGR
jgi:hypothetical protein